MVGTIYSLIPPIVMIILVLLTRKVLLSLGVGIIIGALIITEFDVLQGLKTIWSSFSDIFVAEGAVNLGNVYLLLFLIFLGIMTAYMAASGGTKAFGDWAITKVKTRKGAQLVPSFLGIVIFIDDYFNSLAVGQVARPLTDRYRVSRAKLAYIIDSTSAPITVLAPISSWGAYIIGTLAVIIEENKLIQYEPLEAFVKMIPMNLYAIVALLFVFIVILLKLDIGPMKIHERRAIQTGELVDPNRKDLNNGMEDDLIESKKGHVSFLLIPIIVLIGVTITSMIVTGIQNTTGSVDIFAIFNNTDVNFSLFLGGLIGVIVAMVLYLLNRHSSATNGKVIVEGTKSMLPAIYILLLAWMLGAVIELLETGPYLANLVEQSELKVEYLPFIIFLLCGVMAFATGTSWGTFGIMLPIAGSIAANLDVDMFLPTLAAVLAGSVFGDHCSPISDTTILSSTGAGSNHIDHVMTQLPYAIIGAVVAATGYIVLGITEQILLSILVSIILLLLISFVMKYLLKDEIEEKSL
ncbi:Na+/H+ antiporter NhaC family protein [Salirhabdus sp. Marseille-P4669]|uniref:Na+/H+ antiporter NhaC family protein n=1 Tax=Salirhabdus sp. Marseille-P4669 TaxID=2042310 RepID=UPI000C796180|nr:Na+/H+ antiporter NhaC family protein [Salirhabdus sp. Marseille-P4669]